MGVVPPQCGRVDPQNTPVLHGVQNVVEIRVLPRCAREKAEGRWYGKFLRLVNPFSLQQSESSCEAMVVNLTHSNQTVAHSCAATLASDKMTECLAGVNLLPSTRNAVFLTALDASQRTSSFVS